MNNETPTPTGGQIELKPCPFCGKSPLTKLLPSDRMQATCADCEVNWMSMDDWNTRATDAENAAMREEVERLKERLCIDPGGSDRIDELV